VKKFAIVKSAIQKAAYIQKMLMRKITFLALNLLLGSSLLVLARFKLVIKE
jgi:hypothetical protein